MIHFLIPRHSQRGFTTIEMLITIIVAAMFTISFYQLFITVNQSSAAARHRAVASDIAYANLRRYASAGAAPGTWFTCDGAAGTANTNDLVINANATGSTLQGGSLTSSQVGLPAPVSYSVKALAIYGCNGSNAAKPIRIISQVTYGPKNTVITHATMVAY